VNNVANGGSVWRIEGGEWRNGGISGNIGEEINGNGIKAARNINGENNGEASACGAHGGAAKYLSA
jgi:hypothetical protein